MRGSIALLGSARRLACSCGDSRRRETQTRQRNDDKKKETRCGDLESQRPEDELTQTSRDAEDWCSG